MAIQFSANGVISAREWPTVEREPFHQNDFLDLFRGIKIHGVPFQGRMKMILPSWSARSKGWVCVGLI